MEPQTRMISSTLSMVLNSEMRLVNHLEIMMTAIKFLSPIVIPTPSSLLDRLKVTMLNLMPSQKTQSRGLLNKILELGPRIQSPDPSSVERNLCISHSILLQLFRRNLSYNHKTHPERAYRRFPSSTWRAITLILSYTISFQRQMLTQKITQQQQVSF